VGLIPLRQLTERLIEGVIQEDQYLKIQKKYNDEIDKLVEQIDLRDSDLFNLNSDINKRADIIYNLLKRVTYHLMRISKYHNKLSFLTRYIMTRQSTDI
jgi:hypothetical protein